MPARPLFDSDSLPTLITLAVLALLGGIDLALGHDVPALDVALWGTALFAVGLLSARGLARRPRPKVNDWPGAAQMIEKRVETLPIPVIVVDLVEQRVTFKSREERAMLGIDLGDDLPTIAQTLLSLVHPDDRPLMQAVASRALAGEYQDIQFRIVRPDGEVRWVHGRGIPLAGPDGRITHVIGIREDITERRLTEERLRESEALFRQFADQIEVGLFIAEIPTGRMIYANPAAQALWGSLAGEFMRDAGAAIEYIEPDDRHKMMEWVEANREGNAIEVEYRILIGGEWRWRRTLGFPIAQDDGQVWRMGALVIDITEQKQSADARLEAARLRAELEKGRELAEMRDRLVATISHEFRTPLTVIVSSAELLDTYFDRLSPERRLEHLHKIRGQIHYMTQLLDDVIVLNRGQSGRISFRPEPGDLETLCRTLIDSFRQTPAGQNRQVIFQAGVTLNALFDRYLVQNMVMNLLANAAQYSAPESPIALTLSAEPGYAVITVRDHGIGIPPADHTRLFEPFFRSGNVGARRGVGLGLAIVKHSVDLHGGQIEVQSAEGEGSTFTVRLPLRMGSAPNP
jgi:hypothetical protein